MNLFLLFCSAPEAAVVAWGRGAWVALTQTWTPTQRSAARQSAGQSLWRHATRSPAPDRKVPIWVRHFSVFIASLYSCAHPFAFSAAVPSMQNPRTHEHTFKGYRPHVSSEPSGKKSMRRVFWIHLLSLAHCKRWVKCWTTNLFLFSTPTSLFCSNHYNMCD